MLHIVASVTQAPSAVKLCTSEDQGNSSSFKKEEWKIGQLGLHLLKVWDLVLE